MTEMSWTLDRTDKRCLIVRIHAPKQEGWEQYFLLRSDAHHDNAHADLKLEQRHLDEALARGAGILDVGDLFCAMQGKWDKRASRDAMREEHREGPYLNQLVNVACARYAPYAANWITMSPGNHETSIQKKHEYDLTSSLVARLNGECGSNIQKMPYAHHVIFRVSWGPNQKKMKTVSSINYFGYHGHGGGGPVTKGVIQTNRRATYLPDTHVFHSGHVHEQWVLRLKRDRVSSRGIPYTDSAYHVSTPGYKAEYEVGDGWHIETGKPPKPLGAAWMVLTIRENRVKVEIREAGE